MPVPPIFLECHRETLPLLPEALKQWRRFGGEVVGFTRQKNCLHSDVFYLPDHKNVLDFWALQSGRPKPALYVELGVGEKLTGLQTLPSVPCEVLYVRQIGYERRQANLTRRNLVQTSAGAAADPVLVSGKLFCTLGTYVRGRVNHFQPTCYWCLLSELEAKNYASLREYEALAGLPLLTLLEKIIFFTPEIWNLNRQTLTPLLKKVESLPQSSLLRAGLAFAGQDIESAKELFLQAQSLPVWSIQNAYDYDVYLREQVVDSFLFRFGLLENRQDRILTHGRAFFATTCQKNPYEANRNLLRKYLQIQKLTYSDLTSPVASLQSTVCQTPFLIYTQPRSASSLLTTELHTHPEIECLGELLSGEEPLHILDLLESGLEYIAQRELDAARLAFDVLSKGKATARGLKIHGIQLEGYRATQPDLWLRLITKIPKIIYLRRTPDLRRALSLALAFNNEHFRAHPEFSVYDRVPNIDRVFGALKEQEAQDAHYLQQAREKGCTILYLDAHDYLHERTRTHRKICRFLGLEYAPMHSPLQKQNSWKSEELLPLSS